MVTFYILFVLFFIYIMYQLNEGMFFETLVGCFFGVVVSSIVSAICTIVVGVLIGVSIGAATIDYELKIEGYSYIVTSKDNYTISGNGGGFIIHHMSIETNMEYAMYAKSGDGYILIRLPANRTIIKYDKGEPRIEYWHEVPIESNWKHFALFVKSKHSRYIIYVPEGSIENKFNFDAE